LVNMGVKIPNIISGIFCVFITPRPVAIWASLIFLGTAALADPNGESDSCGA
jgi:hypothetical protein